MPQPARNGLEPWVVLPAYCMFSTFFLYTLHPEQGQKAADTISKVWADSSPAAMEEAKQLSNQVLDTVFQSQLSTFFLGTMMMSVYAMTALVTKVIFLGRLTVIETNKLTERLMMFVLLKVVFFGAVVNPTYKEVGTWATWFFVMGYLKMFVGLAGDRCEALLSSPSSTPLQHLRCLVLLGGILAHVSGWMAEYVASMQGEQARLSSAALWLFDGATVIVEATHGMVKYGVHALERWRSLRAEKRGEDGCGPWEWQGSFLYHLELGTDLLLHCLTMAHYAHLWLVHGLRFQLVDMVLFLDVRYLAVVIWRRLRGYQRYRRLTALVQHSFPDAAPAQLEGAECAICMERMAAAKVLPCRHVFHVPCLRAWLQQSHAGVFSCPMCRASLLEDGGASPGAAHQPAAAVGHAHGHPHDHHIGHPTLGAMAAEVAAAEGQELQQAGRDVEPVGVLLAALAASLAAGGAGARNAWPAGVGGGLDGEDEGALPAGGWAGAGAAYDPSLDREVWAGVEDWPAGGEELLSGITLTDDAAGFEPLCGSDSPLAGSSRGACLAASSGRGGAHAVHDLEDTAASRPRSSSSVGLAAGGEAAVGDGGEGAWVAALRCRLPQQGGLEVSTRTASLAAQSLRTASRAVTQLTRSVAVHANRAPETAEDEAGAVEQPVAGAARHQQSSPVTHHRHRYSTRSKSALA